MSTETTQVRVPRESLASRIEALELPQARSYADFIRQGDGRGPIPCWGAIARRFGEAFTTDGDRVAVLDQLIAEGDARPLLLFISMSRDRPALLAAMCERAGELPLTVQRALVATPEAAELVGQAITTFGPAARRVWDGDAEAMRAERQVLQSRVGELMSFDYFVPDAFDPRAEPQPQRVADATPDPSTDGGTA